MGVDLLAMVKHDVGDIMLISFFRIIHHVFKQNFIDIPVCRYG